MPELDRPLSDCRYRRASRAEETADYSPPEVIFQPAGEAGGGSAEGVDMDNAERVSTMCFQLIRKQETHI